MQFKEIPSEMEVAPQYIQTIYTANTAFTGNTAFTEVYMPKHIAKCFGVSKQWALEVWEIDEVRADGKDGKTILLMSEMLQKCNVALIKINISD